MRAGDRFRQILVIAAMTAGVERVHPVAIVHDDPECVRLELAQIGDDSDRDVADLLLVKRTGEMMMVDHVVPVFRTEDHRDHVPAEKFAAVLGADLFPVLALRQNLAHADP